MYTIQENVRIVISLLKLYNIRYIVISPGGTNIPVSQAVQSDPFFKCYSIPDERSAVYFAIGLYLQTGEIIALSCTSAQATRNYLPGLTEAFYKHVPILAITTSKLKRYEYQDYMQAPDQCSLPVDSVKKSFDLPPISDEHTRQECYQKAREAILELAHRSFGPVQLNLRIDDSKQGIFEEVKLSVPRILQRYMCWDEWPSSDTGDQKILIVVGEHRPFSQRQKNAIEAFCQSHNAVVYVNHISNYVGKFSIQANLLITCGGLAKLRPDILITIGGQTGDYSIFSALRGIGKVEHWRIDETGAYVDTYGILTKIFECPEFYFFEKMVQNSACSHTYFIEWEVLASKMNLDVDLPLSNLFIAQQMHSLIPHNSIMNFAILNSLRSWSYFPLDPSIQCYANVAAFGIDGCNSMLIGASMETEELCFIVTGDLAFFYDMNVLGIRHIKNNLRILLINNNGGAEFKIMTRKWKYQIEVEDFISANGHFGSAKGWAESCRFYYLSVESKSNYLDKLKQFTSESDQPILLEVFTNANDDTIAMEKFIAENLITAPGSNIKRVIKNIIGDQGIELIKKHYGQTCKKE